MSDTDLDAPDPETPGGTATTERVRRRRSRPEQETEQKSTGRRVTFWTGCGLIAAGIAVLCWVAWQFWGTNWQSERRQNEVRDAIGEGWESGQDVVRTEFGNATAIVRIPRFGPDYAMPVLEGSSDEVLAAGIGHMEDTADAGMEGNYVLAAHRVTHGEPFAEFPSLEPGDEVIVQTRAATYTYVLDSGGEDLIIPFTETWVLDEQPVNPDAGEINPPEGVSSLITLLTCSEIFHTDNRSVVFGHLVETTPTSG
ncbi:class E sortase [Nocardioides caeni]|uniref:Class E sortase n=1 Tax=Nocardioides caeni TaxID=574700 RepID=A0A4S8NQZ1_9ACTN|nr:class E sortase [Nocardioides caeni]THV17884.1 class E sortase [Nocardioides caeni]